MAAEHSGKTADSGVGWVCNIPIRLLVGALARLQVGIGLKYSDFAPLKLQLECHLKMKCCWHPQSIGWQAGKFCGNRV